MRTSLTFLAYATVVLGHATFQQLWINGEDQGSSCARLPPSNSPVENLSSIDLRCNVGGATGVANTCSVPGTYIPTLSSRLTAIILTKSSRLCRRGRDA